MLRRKGVDLSRNLACALGAVAIYAAVILHRSIDGATVGTSDPVEAIWIPVFFFAPTLVVFVLAVSRPTSVPIAVLLAIAGGWLWWSVAATWSSTASIGPFLYGWLLGPPMVAFTEAGARYLPVRRSAPEAER